MSERPSKCGLCKHLDVPPDHVTAPARCKLRRSIEISNPWVVHEDCPLEESEES